MKKDISSLRSTLEYLEAAGELVGTDVEVDPHLEVAAIQKRFDGGAALLFNKVKGYPNARVCNNIFASAERIARLLDVDDPRKLKHKVVEALRDPLPPIEVKDAPCQDVVITRDLDVWDVVPMISHAQSDPGRTLGAGNTVVRGTHFWGGSHIGYNRMNFRGSDYSSFQISPGSHMDQVATHWYRKGPIPVTINIGIPPACTMMAGSGFTYVILPRGCDELGVAGALQGYPVELVKARTQDAWSIASAEYVIEGYMDKSYRTYKFQATAITHRADRPLYYGLIVHGMDEHFIDGVVREACFLELADRIVPGLCIDTNIPMGMTDWGGVIFQVKKRRARDEGLHRNILTAALSISLGARLGIVVDEDVDIYNIEDVLWALTTRVNPKEDILTICEGGFGQTFQPAERSSAGDRQWTQSNIRFSGAMGIDATRPFIHKDAFERARYNIEVVDLAKFYSPEQIRQAKEE